MINVVLAPDILLAQIRAPMSIDRQLVATTASTGIEWTSDDNGRRRREVLLMILRNLILPCSSYCDTLTVFKAIR